MTPRRRPLAALPPRRRAHAVAVAGFVALASPAARSAEPGAATSDPAAASPAADLATDPAGPAALAPARPVGNALLTGALPPGATPSGPTSLLSFYGSLESDLGFARYDAEEPGTIDDTFQDHRGRFAFGTLLHRDLPAPGHYFEATAQLVAWVKDQIGKYAVNADDVWGKIGKRGAWDLQIGRFEAWRVYNKFPERDRDPRPGIQMIESTGAFDLFTLEDTGALCTPPVSTGGYCTDIYEVNFILLREEAPSVALHVFPGDNLRLELHGKYGEESQQNQLGLRASAIWRPSSFFELSGGAELRAERSSSPPRQPDPMNQMVVNSCSDCGREDKRGAGGGATLFLGPIELAVNAAYAIVDTYMAINGAPLADASPTLKSFGGYGQVDVGPLTVGGAANVTLRTDPANNHQRHLQTAGYLYWPFAENLSLKAVVSYAEGENDPINLRDTRVPPVNKFLGARVRLKYLFNTF